ncbi:MAG: ornithine carbamoyltransferase [Thermodesulfobacteriota bacterium]
MDLLTIFDLKKGDIDALIERAVLLKQRLKGAVPPEPLTAEPLKGKTLALIFEKPSTRTRVSFEAAMYQLGGNVTFISQADSQIGRGEPVKDTARVMSRYVDGVVIRTFGHGVVEEFAGYATVPVINGLTDLHHPCQVLADVLTIVEKKGGYGDLKVAWVGDGNNMANSWVEAAARLGFELTVACPAGYGPDPDVLERAGDEGIGKVELSESAEKAVKGADVVNTDVWASMGQEEEVQSRKKAFKGYKVDSALVKLAKKDAIVMHCLPAHRGEEITEEVIEGGQSVVWDQAENRLHMQKAILEKLLGNRE